MLRLGFAGLIEPIWSDGILDECFSALARNRPDIGDEQRARLRLAMPRAFPRAAVAPAPVELVLPDPDDVHVVGIAMAALTEIIITYNLCDFPADVLKRVGIRSQHPEALALALLDAEPEIVVRVIREQAAALRRPPTTTVRLLDVLAERGLPRFAGRVANLLRNPAGP